MERAETNLENREEDVLEAQEKVSIKEKEEQKEKVNMKVDKKKML